MIPTMAMVGTTHIAGTPIVENRAALDHQGKTAVKAVFLFCPLLRGRFSTAQKHARLPSRHIRIDGACHLGPILSLNRKVREYRVPTGGTPICRKSKR